MAGRIAPCPDTERKYEKMKQLKIIQKHLSAICTVAFPLIIQGLVFQLQSLTDKAFLGRLDTRYVSAIGAAQMPYCATVDSIVAISTGLIILISQLYGAGKKKEITQYVKSSIFFNTLIGILIFLLWNAFLAPILRFFRVDAIIIDYSIQYIRICSFYFLLLGIDCSLQGFLQGLGRTKPIMYAGILKVLLNVLLSWILIFGKLGLPALYVTGAAIGTLIANIVSCSFTVIYCMVVHRTQFQLSNIDRDWIHLPSYLRMFRLGLPSGLEYFLWNFSNLILIRFINGFSYQDMAIYTITFGCQCIVYVVFSSTSRATLTRMGQNIGAGNLEKANTFFYTCIVLNLCIVLTAAFAFMSIPETLLGIFSTDAQIVAGGVPYLIFLGLIMFPQSINVICGNGIKAHGDTKWMLFSQIIGSTLVITASYLLVNALHMTMMAIYITLFLDETLRGTINYLHYRKVFAPARQNA